MMYDDLKLRKEEYIDNYYRNLLLFSALKDVTLNEYDYSFDGTNLILKDIDFSKLEDNSLYIDEIFDILDLRFEKFEILKYIDLGNIQEIPAYAFSGLEHLEKVVGKHVKSIEHHSFEDCVSLKEIEFKELESISCYSFINCLNLDTINLKGIQYLDLEPFAFEYCHMKALILDENIINNLDFRDKCFKECSVDRLYIPFAMKEKYSRLCLSLEVKEIKYY